MRNSLLVLVFLYVLISPFFILAQKQDSLIQVSGQIVSYTTKSPIPFAHVSVKRRVSIADSLGYYSIRCNLEDSLSVSAIGYGTIQIPVVLHQKDYEFLVVELQATSYQLEEVDIFAFSSYEDFKRQFIAEKLPEPEFKINESIFTELAPFSSKAPSDMPSMYRNNFREKPNVLDAVFRPTDFLYYHLSKKEKSKRKVAKMMRKEKKQAKINAKYNPELIAEVTNLQGEELADFIAYCNSKIKVDLSSSNYDISFQIHKIYNEYKKKLTPPKLKAKE